MLLAIGGNSRWQQFKTAKHNRKTVAVDHKYTSGCTTAYKEPIESYKIYSYTIPSIIVNILVIIK